MTQTVSTEYVNQVCMVMLDQIGRGTVMSVSGGRTSFTVDGPDANPCVVMPVSNGYNVEAVYDQGSDTYIVRRVFTRGGKRFVKGERTDVYCDGLGEACYDASCFRSYDEMEWVNGVRR